MAKETIRSLKETIIKTLDGKKEGMAEAELFALLSSGHDQEILSVAFWNLVKKSRVIRREGKVRLHPFEQLLLAYDMEMTHLTAKLESGVETKKAGHRVKKFEQAGIGQDEAGALPVTQGKRERQAQKLSLITAYREDLSRIFRR